MPLRPYNRRCKNTLNLFRRFEDSYFHDRLTDLRDVIGRVVARLAQDSTQQPPRFKEPVILVASEVLPSAAAMIDKRWVAGIATEAGAATGHAAILARALVSRPSVVYAVCCVRLKMAT
jgi:phosphoenolpyruvate-protein kinase (PTS system EI component)